MRSKILKLYPDYKIFENGKVWSNLSNKFLKPQLSLNGYYKFSLRNKNNGCSNVLLHRLIALAFIPNPYDLPQINHKDGNKLNNSLNNLEWCTPLYNVRHAYKNNLMKPAIGPALPQTKLLPKQVIEIKDLFNSKLSRKEIAHIFNVGTSTIDDIYHNRTWKWLI